MSKVTFEVKNGDVFAHGDPILEGFKGYIIGSNIAIFLSDTWNSYECFVANVATGRIRKLSTADGKVLISDNEIDMPTIISKCENGISNAHKKRLKYGSLKYLVVNVATGTVRTISPINDRVKIDDQLDYDNYKTYRETQESDTSNYDNFDNGLIAIRWELYPGGYDYLDEDGFGAEHYPIEYIYGVIDTNLEFVEPFRPVDNIGEYLKELISKKQKSSSLPQKTTFRSRYGTIQSIINMAFVLLIPLIMILWGFSWVLLSVSIIVAAFFANFMFGTSYTIKQGKLHLKAGVMFSDTIDIKNIISISHTDSAANNYSYDWSFNRLSIKTTKATYMLSPAKESDFIITLLQTNPHIKIE